MLYRCESYISTRVCFLLSSGRSSSCCRAASRWRSSWGVSLATASPCLPFSLPSCCLPHPSSRTVVDGQEGSGSCLAWQGLTDAAPPSCRHDYGTVAPTQSPPSSSRPSLAPPSLALPSGRPSLTRRCSYAGCLAAEGWSCVCHAGCHCNAHRRHPRCGWCCRWIGWIFLECHWSLLHLQSPCERRNWVPAGR